MLSFLEGTHKGCPYGGVGVEGKVDGPQVLSVR